MARSENNLVKLVRFKFSTILSEGVLESTRVRSYIWCISSFVLTENIGVQLVLKTPVRQDSAATLAIRIDSRKVAVEIPDGTTFVPCVVAQEHILFQVALAWFVFSFMRITCEINSCGISRL